MTRADILKKLSQAKTSFETEYLLEVLKVYDAKTTDTLISNVTKDKKVDEDVNFHGNFKSMTEVERDEIINPAHYQVIPSGNYPDGLEYMDLMTYILSHHKGVESHLVGQILKYSIRLGKKDDKLQDAKKIQWYANYLVHVIEQEDGT